MKRQKTEKTMRETGRATLVVISRLVAIIAATFAFAAFSAKPMQPTVGDGAAPRAGERISRP